jgi:hypothetical protein
LYRELDDYERMVITRILSQEFDGRDRLEKQLEHARVRSIEDDDSIEFESPVGFEGEHFKQTVPLETFYRDVDGDTVHLVLHVTGGGRMTELEVFREGGGRVRARAEDNQLRLY